MKILDGLKDTSKWIIKQIASWFEQERNEVCNIVWLSGETTFNALFDSTPKNDYRFCFC